MINYKKTFINTNAKDFPLTKAVDVSAPGRADGTEIIKELINDNWGFSEALLSFVGDTPNEIEESFDNSQKLNSILKIISEVEDVTENGEYTVKKYQKNLVIKVLSGVTSINLRSEEGAVNNKILVLNASGNLLTINDTDVIENGDFIKYLYDGESFQKISNIARTESIASAVIKRNENGTAEVNIPVNELDIANKKYVEQRISELVKTITSLSNKVDTFENKVSALESSINTMDARRVKYDDSKTNIIMSGEEAHVQQAIETIVEALLSI